MRYDARHPGLGPPRAEPVVFTFDARPVTAQPGQTVGAALMAAGQRSWRTTRHAGTRRGIFCGIGVCFDCLVTVDGVPNRRACLTVASAGAVVTTQHGAGEDPDGAS